MTLYEYQTKVDAFIQENGGYWPPLNNLARLTEEVGELARIFNRQFGPKTPKPGETQKEAADELGDLLFIITTLCAQLELSLSEVAQNNLAKVTKRDTGRFKA